MTIESAIRRVDTDLAVVLGSTMHPFRRRLCYVKQSQGNPAGERFLLAPLSDTALERRGGSPCDLRATAPEVETRDT